MLPKSSISPPAALASRSGDATLSVTKAARVLGVHPNTVRAWSDAGRLRYYRINDRGDRRYRQADLQRFLAAAASGSPAQEPEPAASRPARRGAAVPPMLTDIPAGLDLLADLSEIASFPSGLDPALDEACKRIRQTTGAALVGIWERRPGGLVSRAIDAEGAGVTAARTVAPGRGLFSLAIDSPTPIHARPGLAGPAPVLGLGTDELVVRIPGGDAAWGLLVLAGAMQLGHRRRTAPGGCDRANAGRPDPERHGHRAGVRAPPPVRGAATRCHGPCVAGSTWATSCGISAITPGSCSDRTGWPWSSAIPRAASRRPVASGSRPGSWSWHAGSRRAGPDGGTCRRGGPRSCWGPAPGAAAAARSGRRPSRMASSRCWSRRWWMATTCRHALPGPRPGAPLARGGPRRRRGPGRRCVHRCAFRAHLRADGGLGGPAPVDPAPGRPPVGPVGRGRDRPCHRHRAPRADRLRERARLPRPGPGPGARCDARARRRVLRRDGREADRHHRRGDHRLGCPVPRAPARG